jgi:hypothetical protein
VQSLRDRVIEAYNHVLFLVFHAGYGDEQKEIWWVFTYIHALYWSCLQRCEQSYRGTKAFRVTWHRQCHHHLAILGTLAQVSDFSFPMKTEPGIASLECVGNWFVTLREFLFGQSLRSWWENEREYGLLLSRGVWPTCTRKKFCTMKCMYTGGTFLCSKLVLGFS